MTAFKTKGSAPVRLLTPALEDIERRLNRLGVAALSNRELCTLLGFKHRPLMRALEERGLATLLTANAEELSEAHGLPPGACHRLLAAAELGRRALQNEERRPYLATPLDVHRYVRPLLAQAPREEVHVLSFNTRNILLRHHRAALGSVDSCPVDVREVFAPALAARAAGVVLVHNHPSGSPEPSAADVELTHHLASAGKLLGVKLLDHLVVGFLGFVSLAQRGVLSRAPGSFVATHAGEG
ncbi:MAG: DNA repair protein RadC [Myxococcaceae bacterium]|nr:DNA repair protein RadC [Myxococcaceae bacterium]